jgi:hypothetical protein
MAAAISEMEKCSVGGRTQRSVFMSTLLSMDVEEAAKESDGTEDMEMPNVEE